MPPRLYEYSQDPSTAPSSSRYPDPPYSSLNDALGAPPAMANDGRYLYHGPQPIQPYEYAAYPAAQYDSTQIPQRPIRPPTHHPQSSFQPPPPAPAPSPYQTPYASAAAYQVPPPHPQHHHHHQQQQQPPPPPQWTGDGWAQPQYQHPHQHPHQPQPPFASAPPPSVHDPSFASGPGRPDAAPNQSPDPRAYPPLPPPPSSAGPDPRRSVRSSASTPQPQSKRESSQPTGRIPAGQLDYTKLLESYRLVIHESHVLSTESLPAQARPLPQETMERMFQSAQFGLHMLDTIQQQLMQPSPAEVSPPADRPPASTAEMPRELPAPPPPSSTGVIAKPRKDPPVAEGQMCLGCNATSTPEWRRGPMGPRTLCNACGLVYAKLIKKRSREAARGRGGGSGARSRHGGHGFGEDAGAASSGEGGSDDDDSFGSQDRASDAGGGGGRE